MNLTLAAIEGGDLEAMRESRVNDCHRRRGFRVVEVQDVDSAHLREPQS